MKVRITDPAAFQALNHRDVRAYLVQQGWAEGDRIADLAAEWTGQPI